MILSLVWSAAAPYGAVFASEEVVSESEAVEVNLPIEEAETPVTEQSAASATPLEDKPSAIASAPEASPVAATPPLKAVSATVTTLPSPIVPTGSVVISAFEFRQEEGFAFVELRNIDGSYADVNNMSVRLLYSTSSTDYECEVPLTGYIRPNSYVTYVQASLAVANPGAYTMSGCPVPTTGLLFDKEIQVYRGDQLIESVRITEANMGGQSSKQWERKGFTSSYLKGSLSDDFKTSTRAAYTSAFYKSPSASTLQFLEIFPRPFECSSADPLPMCRPYVKIMNIGNDPIDLSEFRLRNGAVNARPSTYNTSSLAGTIAPGDFMTITQNASGGSLAINDEDGATWLEDQYGLTTYANADPPYTDAELVAQRGRSWAYDMASGMWRWALPNPYEEQNIFPAPEEPGKGVATDGLKPCRDDQYRSEETNRCRAILSTSGLMPCKEGQYRSEETNRCRSIASTAASVLKPCGDDQFRNPATNRCKKIASSEDPADCGEGREHNPATNRCRNVIRSDVPAAAFGVEPIKDSATAFVAWWALGGVAVLALGYGGWEWRREIMSGVKRVTAFLHSKP